MRVVLVDAPKSLLDERRRLGMDKFDEVWEGEWHFVHPPKSWHTRLNFDLGLVLGPRARALGLEPFGDGTGVFAGEKDWRIPDQVYVRPERVVEEGVTGAELVVELYSPGDESYTKLPFYAARRVSEVPIVHRDRRFELFRLDDAGTYQPVEDGRSTVLGVSFSTVAGPKLRID
jgi:Uma2 family endonuclease